MAVSAQFREYVLEQMRELGVVTPRAMFGGVGLYFEELFFALLDDDVLYLKVDDRNVARFEAAGSRPFRPFGEGTTPMHYYEVPADVLDDPGQLKSWSEGALDAARTARGKSRRRKSR